MSIYVLIHGAWHGGWVWDGVRAILEEQDHTVYTPDLPSHGDDTTPLAQVSMKAYINRVLKLIDSLNEPVVLVGHSLGGVVISNVAEERPQKIKKLVYVTALLLKPGQTTHGMMQADPNGQLLDKLQMAGDGSYASASEQTVRSTIYNDVPSDIADQSLPRLIPKQATEPFGASVTTTNENFGQIPRAYLLTSKDVVITPALQKNMIEALPCETVIDIPAGHVPMLSQPKLVATALLKIE